MGLQWAVAAFLCLSEIALLRLLFAEERAVDHIAQTVNGEQVNFLNARSHIARHADFDIVTGQQGAHMATVFTGQSNHGHITFVSRLNRLKRGERQEKQILQLDRI